MGIFATFQAVWTACCGLIKALNEGSSGGAYGIKREFRDASGLSAAIGSPYRYESLSNMLWLKSKQHLEHFSWDKAARKVKALYYEVIGKE